MVSHMIEVFVGALAIALFALLAWACKALPAERWQFVAAVPLRKHDDGHWTGLNLTFYGALTALSYMIAVATIIIMTGALAIPLAHVMALVAGLLVLIVPSSRWVAEWIEKKPCTFTIGGAVFIAAFACPAAIIGANLILAAADLPNLPILPLLAAMATGYTIGEGLGRIACISFGCCYGKPVDQTFGISRRLFNRLNFVFHGATKKIAYESQLDGVPVVPIQGMTAALYIVIALAGFWLFMRGQFATCLLLTMGVTQLWRAWSETLRADHRGGGGVSAYQWMAIATALLSTLYALVFRPTAALMPDLSKGLEGVWAPSALISLQFLGLVIFLYTGCSEVTQSSMRIHVCRDKT